MQFGLLVCLSVCPDAYVKNYRSDLLDLFAQEVVYPSLGHSLRRSGSGLKNLFKESSPLEDRTKYAIIKVRHDFKRAL